MLRVILYFNPRSLTGATFAFLGEQAVLNISIHAPSRERPSVQKYLKGIDAISIHAPSRERRLPRSFSDSTLVYFNPRSLTGATRFLPLQGGGVSISIHAPSRERQLICPNVASYPVFQSTLPHGSDRKQASDGHNLDYFNPRSLTGATEILGTL